MNSFDLRVRLYQVALAGLAEANRSNPFISKADAMRSVNFARQGLRLVAGELS